MTTTLSADQHKILMPGLAVQPLIAGTVGFFLLPPSGPAIVMGVFFAMTGAAITGCIAYPIMRRFIRRRQLTLVRTLASGALLGNIPAAIAATAIMAASTDTAAKLASLLLPIGVGTVTGMIMAAAFWALSGRRIAQLS